MDCNRVLITCPVKALSLSTDRNCGGPEIVKTQWIKVSETTRASLSFVRIANTELVCLQVVRTINLKLSNPSGIYFISTAKCSKGM